MTVAVIFPGQGAQAPGLGEPWRGHAAWSLVERAEAALHQPLAPLLLDATAEELSRTREAQLVVFLASLLAWEGAREAVGEPVAFAGHSLGQITALVAAGALPFEDGVLLAARRAELTQAAADEQPGRMVALLGATVDQAHEACSAAPNEAWLANDNGPGQLILGGTPAGTEAASARARELGIRRVTTLNVGGAFHTPLMAGAAAELAGDLQQAPFVDTALPVLSNTDGQAYTDGEGWIGRLVDQLVSTVRWTASMQTLVRAGATGFVEVGPGTTLTGLAKRAVPGVSLRNVATPADVPQLSEVR